LGKEILVFDYLKYFLISGVVALANLLPIQVSYWLAKRVGDLSYLVMPKRRRIALENLSRAYGDTLSLKQKRKIARCSFEHVALSIVELFTVSGVLKNASEKFSFEGTSYLDAAFEKGKGVILVISHVGSWEYLAFLPYLKKYPCSVVVKTLKNQLIDRMMNQCREKTLLHPIPKKDAAKKILYEIHKNHLVAILIDQWAGHEGIRTDFFNVETSTTSIPVRIAEKTGCALVPAYCLRKEGGRYEIHIEAPLDWDVRDPDWEKRVTQKLNQCLERQILAHPEQWLWGHRRWK
jgi:KDO2-lipid IV(A) lauroyltransferase